MIAALQTVSDIDTSETSSLAYASGLLAIEIAVIDVVPQEVTFNVMVGDDNTLTIDADELEIATEIRAAIDVIATHYFQSIRLNLPLCVH